MAHKNLLPHASKIQNNVPVPSRITLIKTHPPSPAPPSKCHLLQTYNQPFERPRDDNNSRCTVSGSRDRPSTRKKKPRKDRPSSSSRAGDPRTEVGGAGAAGVDGTGAGAAGADGYGDEEEEGEDGGVEAGAAGGDDTLVTVGGVIPGSHISILPSFMDELKTRASMPVRSVVEPALTVYCVRGGGLGRGGGRAGSGRKSGGRGGGGGRNGSGSGSSRKDELSCVEVEPVYKFRL